MKTESGMTDHGALVLAGVAQSPLKRRVAHLERRLRLIRDQIEIEIEDGRDTPALRLMMRDVHAALSGDQ